MATADATRICPSYYQWSCSVSLMEKEESVKYQIISKYYDNTCTIQWDTPIWTYNCQALFKNFNKNR